MRKISAEYWEGSWERVDNKGEWGEVESDGGLAEVAEFGARGTKGVGGERRYGGMGGGWGERRYGAEQENLGKGFFAQMSCRGGQRGFEGAITLSSLMGV